MIRSVRTCAACTLALLAATGSLVACDPGTDSAAPPSAVALPTAPTTPSGARVSAITASFEVVARRPERVLFGISADDGSVLAGGTVTVRFRHVAPAPGSAEPLSDAVLDTTATYYPVPGQRTGAPETPRLGAPADGLGVYAARDVVFPAAGFWQANLTATTASGPLALQTAVAVLDDAEVLDVGDAAPKTANPLPGDAGVPLARIDSRLSIDGVTELPAPQLHDRRIADLLAGGQPFVVVVSTPVFCQSQFCGPITDVAAALATEYEGRVEVVHLEVWEDFSANRVNPFALEWIGARSGAKEPWVFVVGRDGGISARFDNLVNEAELRAAMDAVAV